MTLGIVLPRYTRDAPEQQQPRVSFDSGQGCVDGQHQEVLQIDADGDYELPRRNSGVKRGRSCEIDCVEETVSLRQHTITPLDEVGLQLWRGALALCDAIVHHYSGIRGGTALEMGGGVGLCSILLSRFVQCTFCTDLPCALPMAAENVAANRHLGSGEIVIRALDWMTSTQSCGLLNILQSLPSDEAYHQGKSDAPVAWGRAKVDESAEERCAWRQSDACPLKHLELIVASDVIYDDDLTDSFFSKLIEILRTSQGRDCRCLLTLEKRFNFSVEDMAVVANGYEAFLQASAGPELCVQRLPLDDIPISFRPPYDRGSDIELWEIRLTRQT